MHEIGHVLMPVEDSLITSRRGEKEEREKRIEQAKASDVSQIEQHLRIAQFLVGSIECSSF